MGSGEEQACDRSHEQVVGDEEFDSFHFQRLVAGEIHHPVVRPDEQRVAGFPLVGELQAVGDGLAWGDGFGGGIEGLDGVGLADEFPCADGLRIGGELAVPMEFWSLLAFLVAIGELGDLPFAGEHADDALRGLAHEVVAEGWQFLFLDVHADEALGFRLGGMVGTTPPVLRNCFWGEGL